MFKKYLLVILIFLLSSTANSEIQKIVYLNMDRIMEQSIAGKSIKSYLENKHESNIKKFKKLNNEIIKKEKDLIAQKNVLSQEDFQKELNKLRSDINNFQKQQAKARDDINKIRVSATNKFIVELTPILETFAKENSIQLILQKKNSIMGKKEIEITDKILLLADKKIKNFKID